MPKSKAIAEYGDFQTPPQLAQEVCALLKRKLLAPATVIEPTCGKGSFLQAAAEAFPSAKAIGLDINAQYVQEARERVPTAELRTGDFFATDWRELLGCCAEPILMIGNPPWVTNAELGTLKSGNLPAKSNFQGQKGLDAMTGKSNFDISEWMLMRLMAWLAGRSATIAMLCKTAVARKVLAYAWKNDSPIANAQIYGIDALKHFEAAVDACLLICDLRGLSHDPNCCVYDSLATTTPRTQFGLRDGRLVADIAAYEGLCHLAGKSPYRWRSGIKHDCSKVMELTKEGSRFRNGLGECVELENTYLYPMLKSSELAGGRAACPRRWMLVPQRSVGDDTSAIETRAPLTWSYLTSHAGLLGKRGSSIYKNRPPYSVFGVGDYTFEPWRVAISGFYKKLTFTPVGKAEGKPIVLDDTAYLIACRTKDEAHYLSSLLNSDEARRFYSAYVFWNAKRPITVEILSLLSLTNLARQLGSEDELLHHLQNGEGAKLLF